MSTHRSRRIDRATAEQLLADARSRASGTQGMSEATELAESSGTSGGHEALAGLLAAAAAPAGKAELAGEQDALAMFRAARLAPAADPSAAPAATHSATPAPAAVAVAVAVAAPAPGSAAPTAPAPTPRKRSLRTPATLLGAKVAAAVLAAALGGVAVAAGTGNLPRSSAAPPRTASRPPPPRPPPGSRTRRPHGCPAARPRWFPPTWPSCAGPSPALPARAPKRPWPSSGSPRWSPRREAGPAFRATAPPSGATDRSRAAPRHPHRRRATRGPAPPPIPANPIRADVPSPRARAPGSTGPPPVRRAARAPARPRPAGTSRPGVPAARTPDPGRDPVRRSAGRPRVRTPTRVPSTAPCGRTAAPSNPARRDADRSVRARLVTVGVRPRLPGTSREQVLGLAGAGNLNTIRR